MLSPQPRFGFKLQILSKPATSEGKMATTIAAVTGRLLNPHHTMDSASPKWDQLVADVPNLKEGITFLASLLDPKNVKYIHIPEVPWEINIKAAIEKGVDGIKAIYLVNGKKGSIPCKKALQEALAQQGNHCGDGSWCKSSSLMFWMLFWQQI